MLTITDTPSLRKRIAAWRLDGKRIAFVPTMGNLHAGHLYLIERAKSLAPKVVVSIFVNPMQFDRADDLTAYPRTLEEDRFKLDRIATDLLFLPDVSQVYPLGVEHSTRVEVPGLSDILCGASRPGHFRGVATVVTKLFNMVQPDIALFGEKDFQQLMLIRRLVADLSMPIEISGVPTRREADGLAMSSRNNYLDAQQRQFAPRLYQTLTTVAKAIQAGERVYRELEQQAIHQLEACGMRPDYVRICRQSDLNAAENGDDELAILAASWLGKARLIDNILVCLKEDA